MEPKLGGVLADTTPSVPTHTATTPDTTPSGAVWTITRQAGRVKHERVINEAFLQPGELAVLKGLVRA